MIVKYYDFLIESILFASENIKDIIGRIDDPIAKILSNLFEKDIDTKYNILDTTDTNDRISFITNTNATSKVESGINPEELFRKTNSQTTIGRVIRSILTDNNISYTDHDIEIFVNKFKSTWDMVENNKKNRQPISIVKGEDIRYWYKESNYCKSTLNGKGTLGNSCMKYDKCQKYLEIYVRNPDQVSMIIYVDDENKLLSRALLWNTNKGVFLDRIYYTNDSDENLIYTWAKANCNVLSLSESNLEVKLTGWSNADGSYDYYPYMDTMIMYYIKNRTLYSEDDIYVDHKNCLFELQDTDGTGLSMDRIYCSLEDQYYNIEETRYSTYHGSHISIENSIWSRFHNSYVHTEYVRRSKILDDYISSSSSCLVYLDADRRTSDYYPKDSRDISFYNGKFYLKSLMKKDHKGLFVLLKDIVKTYKVKENSIDKFTKIYNIKSDSKEFYTTIYDKDIFNIDLHNNEILMSKYDLYKNLYLNTVYTDFSNKLKKDSKINNLKKDEHNCANEYLNENFIIYKNRNYISSVGIDSILDIWKNEMNIQKSTNFIFNLFYKKDIISEIVKKGLYNEVCDYATELLSDPRYFMLGFGQNELAENNIKIKNEVYKEIEKRFSSIDQITLDGKDYKYVITDLILKIYTRSSSNVSTPVYLYERWSTIFTHYLKNQDLYKDIVKQ